MESTRLCRIHVRTDVGFQSPLLDRCGDCGQDLMFYPVTARRDGREDGLVHVGFPTTDHGHTDSARSAGIVWWGTITDAPGVTNTDRALQALGLPAGGDLVPTDQHYASSRPAAEAARPWWESKDRPSLEARYRPLAGTHRNREPLLPGVADEVVSAAIFDLPHLEMEIDSPEDEQDAACLRDVLERLHAYELERSRIAFARMLEEQQSDTH